MPTITTYDALGRVLTAYLAFHRSVAETSGQTSLTERSPGIWEVTFETPPWDITAHRAMVADDLAHMHHPEAVGYDQAARVLAQLDYMAKQKDPPA